MPALTRECHKCKQVGHFAAVCKWTRRKGKAPKAVGYVSLHRAGTRQEDQLVPISVQHGSNPPSKVCWLPDGGTEIDAMSEQDCMQLGTRPQELSPDPDRLHAADGGELNSAGVFQANLQLGRNVCTTTVHEFKDLKTSLLSKSSCIHLGLLEEDWPQSRLQTIQSLSLPTENSQKNASALCQRLELSKEQTARKTQRSLFEEKPFKAPLR